MFLNGKGIDQITEDDLLALIDREEDKYLDFKRNAYIPAGETKMVEKQQWEFAADLASFANASGGYIICGMGTTDGRASDLKGLGEANTDLTINTLTQVAEYQVEPRIPGLQIRAVKLANATAAIVIYIPESFAGPHWVKGTQQFHSRRSNGKTKMDLDELRRAFSLSENFIERIRGFRLERVEAILSGNQQLLPVVVQPGAKLITHAIPVSFVNNAVVDLKEINKIGASSSEDFESYSDFGHFDFDGYAVPFIYQKDASVSDEGYIRVFRTGVIECVRKLFKSSQDQINLMSLEEIENESLQYIHDSLEIQRSINIETPIVVALSLAGIQNHHFVISRDHPTYKHQPSTNMIRKEVVFPEIVVEDYKQDIPSLMRPIFDMLWNGAGKLQTHSYTEAGSWKHPNRLRYMSDSRRS
jgi:hypothetical protein